MKKIDFFGTRISWICEKEQLKLIYKLVKNNIHAYITYSNVHVVVTGRKNLDLRNAINNAIIASPDGKPISVVGRLKGAKCIEKCSGPDMMIKIIENGLQHGYRHYFYGGEEKTLRILKERLIESYPEIKIVGMYSPPFRELTSDEEKKIIEEINNARPDCIWVSLGAPKQELWMYRHKDCIKKGVMFGVGAAFNFLAKTQKRAPVWMQKYGLEWFYRLIEEPRRLWKRYLTTNIFFIMYLLRFGVTIIDEPDEISFKKENDCSYICYCGNKNNMIH